MDGFWLTGSDDALGLLTPARGVARLGYWGPSGFDQSLDELAALVAALVPHGILDDGEAMCWFPEAGQGFTGHPALLGHRDGIELVTQLELVRRDGGTLTYADARAEIEVELALTIDAATNVVTSRTTVRNLSATPLTLDWCAAGAVEVPHAELLLFDGRWVREFTPVRQTLVTGIIAKENRTGRTSHHAPPFMLVGEAGFGEAHGEVFALHLAWSGNHRMFAERLRDGRIQLQAGELLAPGEIILARGESYTSPALYIARSDVGLNGISARLHPFVRDIILGGRLRGKPRKVHINSWEAVYFAHDHAGLCALADAAAQVGAERFVLDDGWFKGRGDDRAGLGDWVPDAVKYPRGLKPLIDHVHGLGMDFGLWVEPEMANADSDLLRAHPDWVLGAPGRTQLLGRGQYALDLTRSEVTDHLFGVLDGLLRDNAIAYLKWDMNRDLVHAVSGGRGAVHRQTLALYTLIDRLCAAHPHVEIEACASGGARADYEILKRTDRIWTSDCNDPIERQAIQRAFSIFFPPEVMGAHFGPADCHTTARRSSAAMRAWTAFAGHMGIEADLRRCSETELATLAGTIAHYKAWRDVLHGGATLRLETADPGCIAVAFGGPRDWIVSVAQVATAPHAAPLPLRLPMCAEETSYRAELLNPRAGRQRAMRSTTPFIRGDAIAVDGALLARRGLHLPILHAGEIAVVQLTEVTS
ncbi:alpha-galactosidase [Polymorphobacter arshaanensis]|uniref:Alpha-galactosidase n=1 Tax=Glacieibacterium arshaanense TaxID=2511025 RepID=A0A4Y9ER84_9SPHN|nr:alpha-galactosidase [Polymorphobacter arshaanensis]TFU05962.1 alpha-galactosidase [Polymorphobacter arshaanensis]